VCSSDLDGRKTYLFTVTWGGETNTDDLEGEFVNQTDVRPNEAAISDILSDYTGEIEQIPPAFSAVKINGERAYKLAREGEKVDIAPRIVEVYSLDIVEHLGNQATVFRAECGKGTYVRAIARDMGRDLGCYGHISELRRISVGPFDEEDLIPLDELIELEDDLNALDGEVHATGIALEELPEIAVSISQVNRIRSGNPVLLRGRDALTFAEEAIVTCGDELVALGYVEKGSFNPRRVFKDSTV